MSMSFTKFGKALCMGALSAGLIFGIASCVESYTVGFLYVTGTVTASTGDNGIISGYKIDHNTGRLATINTLPVASGGANPVRAVLTLGSRFLYVLNRGVNGSGNGECTETNPCENANITEFAVGGNGTLTPEQTFYTQGINPFRLIADTTGSYLLALDHDAPDSNEYTGQNATSNSCSLALGGGVTSCGDITVFKIDQTTGRLTLVVNAQVTAAGGLPINYFPVPANPVDFVLSGGYVLTLTGAPEPSSFPYVGGTEVWPYAYGSTSGQLTLSQNSAQPMGIDGGTAIVNAGNVIYVLDNQPITIGVTSPQVFPAGLYPGGQILPWGVTTGGALQAETSGIFPDDVNLANPIQLLPRVQRQISLRCEPGEQCNRTESSQRHCRLFPHDFTGLSAEFHCRRTLRHRFGSAVHRRGPLQPVHLRSKPVRLNRHRTASRSEYRRSGRPARDRQLYASGSAYLVPG